MEIKTGRLEDVKRNESGRGATLYIKINGTDIGVWPPRDGEQDLVAKVNSLGKGANVDYVLKSTEKGGKTYHNLAKIQASTRTGQKTTAKDIVNGGSPPIVSNVLASAVGNGGLIHILIESGQVVGTSSVMGVLREIGNLAWELSAGPVSLDGVDLDGVVGAKEYDYDSNSEGPPEFSDEDIPF